MIRHVDGFSTAAEVLADLCRCQSPVCPLPHAPAAVRAFLEGDLCTCLEAACRRPHTQEASARFVLNASGYELWSLRHAGPTRWRAEGTGPPRLRATADWQGRPAQVGVMTWRLASLLDPHVHGVLTAAQLDEFRGLGYRVHRVGHAAYLHRDSRRWIFGVWEKREDPPAWADRLRAYRRWWLGRGPMPGPEARRAFAWWKQRQRMRLRAPSGRFVGGIPWWAEVDAVGRLLTPRHLAPWRLT